MTGLCHGSLTRNKFRLSKQLRTFGGNSSCIFSGRSILIFLKLFCFSLYNHIKPASELKPGTDYSLFKKGIMPMWEDAANKRGGRWLMSLDRKQRNELDRYWLDIVRFKYIILKIMVYYSILDSLLNW